MPTPAIHEHSEPLDQWENESLGADESVSDFTLETESSLSDDKVTGTEDDVEWKIEGEYDGQGREPQDVGVVDGDTPSPSESPHFYKLIHDISPYTKENFHFEVSVSYSSSSRPVIKSTIKCPTSTNRSQFTLQLSFNDTDINIAQCHIVHPLNVSGNEVGTIMEEKTANGREGGTRGSVAVATEERVKSTLGGLPDTFQQSEKKPREREDGLKEESLKSVGVDRGGMTEGEWLADLVKTCTTEALELQKQVVYLKKEVAGLQEMLKEEQRHWSTMKVGGAPWRFAPKMNTDGVGKESERFSIKIRTQLLQLRLRSLLVAS